MGQCTSGELPPTNVDNRNGNTEVSEASSNINESPIHSSSSSTKKYRRSRHSAATSWMSNRLNRRQKKSDLSATFNLLDHEIKGKLVNINTATEEELMTLAGISRQLARNIVEYRSTIGGFRRIEDLVLVSGIGASVLQSIKNDVTIKKYPSYSSSRTQSFDSIPSCESLKSHKSSQSTNGRSVKSSPSKLINVNSASIFELMNVRGMSQEMAANIVHYRSKKGGFKHIDEMVKVRGINHRILSLLRIYITCENISPSSPVISDSLSVSSYGKPPLPPPVFRVTGHRRTHSAPLHSNDDSIPMEFIDSESTNNHRFSSEFSADLFELLSLRSDRPLSYNIFNGTYQGLPAARIGCWNLQKLSIDKVNNLGVLEVICRTILETGFSLIALQEVISKDVLEKICCELNCGSLRRVREWNGPRGEWRWQVGEDPIWRSNSHVEYAAFIYNTCHGVHLVDCCLLQVHNNNNSKYSGVVMRKPYLGYFRVNNVEFVLVNLHLKTREKERSKMIEEEGEVDGVLNGSKDSPTHKSESSKRPFEMSTFGPLIAALKDKLDSEKYVIHLGSFDLPPDDKAFDVLHDTSHSPVISSETPTDICYDNPKGRECVDNIWLSTYCQKLYTSSCGVVREGLSHMAIPRGWGWGGMVSDHCPIYCDLYTKVVNRPQWRAKDGKEKISLY